jgi:hypothetical protein
MRRWVRAIEAHILGLKENQKLLFVVQTSGRDFGTSDKGFEAEGERESRSGGGVVSRARERARRSARGGEESPHTTLILLHVSS